MKLISASELYFPTDFFGNETQDDKKITPCESLMKEIISFHLDIDPLSVIRGDADKGEPDFKVGNDWIEIRYSEERAQRQMKTQKQCQRFDQLSQFFEEVENAIEKKAEKKYSVAEKAVGIFSLMDASFLAKETSKSSLEEYILCERDRFFDLLVTKYIANKKFKNIYIVTIGYNRTFVLFDLDCFRKKEDFIHTIGISEESTVPYRVVKEVTTNETTI